MMCDEERCVEVMCDEERCVEVICDEERCVEGDVRVMRRGV